MPSFEEHFLQANNNILFLNKLKSEDKHWDWKVTISFYAALHLINAHIAKKVNMHYLKHTMVNDAINPMIALSPTKVTEDVYVSYRSLQCLSRRARYLTNDKHPEKDSDKAHYTFDKHYNKGLYHLREVIAYFEKAYKTKVEIVK